MRMSRTISANLTASCSAEGAEGSGGINVTGHSRFATLREGRGTCRASGLLEPLIGGKNESTLISVERKDCNGTNQFCTHVAVDRQQLLHLLWQAPDRVHARADGGDILGRDPVREYETAQRGARGRVWPGGKAANQEHQSKIRDHLQ